MRVTSYAQAVPLAFRRGVRVVEQARVKGSLRLNCVDPGGRPFTVRIQPRPKAKPKS